MSVDSLEEEDLLRGGRAGADYLLSLKESTLWIADEVESIPILIAETHGDMDPPYTVLLRSFQGKTGRFMPMRY